MKIKLKIILTLAHSTSKLFKILYYIWILIKFSGTYFEIIGVNILTVNSIMQTVYDILI